MKSAEQTIKNNQKFLRIKAEKQFANLTSKNLTLYDKARAAECIFCTSYPISDLFFDITAEFYNFGESKKSYKNRWGLKCNHGGWISSSTYNICRRMQGAITYGLPVIWSMYGDLTKVPEITIDHIIAMLVDFDTFQFFVHSEYEDSRSWEFFAEFQFRESSKEIMQILGETGDDKKYYDIIFSETKDILNKIHEWQYENKIDFIPDEIAIKMISDDHTYLNKLSRNTFISMIKEYQKKYEINWTYDFIMLSMEKLGSEWFKSLPKEKYSLEGLENISTNMEKEQQFMTTEWTPDFDNYNRKNQRLEFKKNLEEKLGTKPVFPFEDKLTHKESETNNL